MGLRAAEAVIPQNAAPDRYRAVWEKSPFGVASTDEVPKATWVLVGMTESETDPILYLMNQDTKDRMVVTKEPNAQGYAVESVHYDANPLRSSAKLKGPGDAKNLVVRYDPLLLVVNNPAPAGKVEPGAANAATGDNASANANANGEDGGRRRRFRRTQIPNPSEAATPAVAPAPAPAAAPAAAPANPNPAPESAPPTP
ncbi:hypothetical protein SAMN05444156_1766 [Verrucomicrobium sp. GAS474]|nr:hypothetical protein SAMN05444156_1766 [Verrucomicrobium sp. GAS474]